MNAKFQNLTKKTNVIVASGVTVAVTYFVIKHKINVHDVKIADDAVAAWISFHDADGRAVVILSKELIASNATVQALIPTAA